MNAVEIGTVLAKAAAFDRRKVGEADILAWLEAIGDLGYADALAAVTRHFRDSTEYLQPAHIRQHVEEIDRDRRRAAREHREDQAKEAERLAIEAAPRTDRSRELAEAIREVVAKVETPDAALERAKLVARQMKGRPVIPPKVKRTETVDRRKRPEYGPPQDEGVAQLARQYLADGHRPDDLSERLWISRDWLRRAAADRASLPPPTPIVLTRPAPEETP